MGCLGVLTMLVALAAIGIGGLGFYGKDPTATDKETIPATMKRLRYVTAGTNASYGTFKVEEVPVPEPGPNEVLVRVVAAPINPSDTLYMRGLYKADYSKRTGVGFEGSGVVVKSGGGPMGILGKWYLDDNVAFAMTNGQGGSYAQYVVTDVVNGVLPLNDDTTLEQGASSIVNPMTVAGFVETMHREGHKAAVHTAAASALGKILLRVCKLEGLGLVNVVRRQAQKDILVGLGARPEDVLISTESDFQAQLAKAVARTGASIAFDAVAGAMSSQLLEAMPPKGKVSIYGVLSGQACQNINPASFVFDGKVLEGFHLMRWLQDVSFPKQMFYMNKMSNLLSSAALTEYSSETGLDGIVAAAKKYDAKGTNGKVLVRPFQA